ncbi:hypothetical protein P168DRAFT_43040 [Aspergillus campestris IBT 28561]|uniref:Uncharacterized protein n=1 Tax=Aspergillus campestris (strain IBT 28561) TaxID=1392248 RepID=A0A2I1CX56_ASPC2|nr:uncharacterized protein P168DRAFT_43040 [Aspergillus campestris IBT 28561]PKY02217.1 hypothetical protein P168DRAFT_43040 [Aspergillus campestris IBT 28561]
MLVKIHMNWITARDAYTVAMSTWRQNCRTWEIELIKTYWANDRTVFPNTALSNSEAKRKVLWTVVALNTGLLTNVQIVMIYAAAEWRFLSSIATTASRDLYFTQSGPTQDARPWASIARQAVDSIFTTNYLSQSIHGIVRFWFKHKPVIRHV